MDYYNDRQNQAFIQNVAKAINGEYSAIHCYATIAAMAPREKERNRILEIRQDEIRHYELFSRLYTQLTGQQPTPVITEACPRHYGPALRFAVEDEQNTVDFYLEMSDQAPDPHTKELLRRIAQDEQNHAVWFLYFLVQRQPTN